MILILGTDEYHQKLVDGDATEMPHGHHGDGLTRCYGTLQRLPIVWILSPLTSANLAEHSQDRDRSNTREASSYLLRFPHVHVAARPVRLPSNLYDCSY